MALYGFQSLVSAEDGTEVEWFAANPGFHPIPPGYGLPWGNEEEADIPQELLLEAEMSLAREQMATQSPRFSEQERDCSAVDRSHRKLHRSPPTSPDSSNGSERRYSVGKIDNGMIRTSKTSDSADEVIKASAGVMIYRDRFGRSTIIARPARARSVCLPIGPIHADSFAATTNHALAAPPQQMPP